MSSTIEKLKKRYAKIEAQLEKVRDATPLTHGWQTSKLAKAQRKADYLAMEKNKIRAELNNPGIEI